VNRAATVVAAELIQAQTVAGRQQVPVVAFIDGPNKRIEIRQTGGSTISVRQLGTSSEYKLTTLTATTTSILVLPNGTTSGAVTVTVGTAGYTRQVRMTRAGLVRVL
jgi:hypothetical protein